MSTGAQAATGAKLTSAQGFLAGAYAFAVTMVGTTLPTPLYAFYRERFGFSELMITVIFATYAAGVITGLLLFGRVSDQLGRRPVLLAGLALSATSAVCFLLAGGLAMLLVGRLISGLSAGIFTGTATALLVDLASSRSRGTLVATVANMGGLGCGPLIAGALAQWVSSPIRVPFWVDLGLLVPAAVGVWALPEPVKRTGSRWIQRPELRVPVELRSPFIRAALAGFAGFSVLGLFTAVSPAFLAQGLSVKSHAVVGLVVFVVFAASAVGQMLLGRFPDPMSVGCGTLITGMALLALGLALSSLALLVVAGIAAGLGQGLSFRAGLDALTEAAPPEHRAAVASSFFIVAYLAISVPVIGEGVLADLAGLRTAGLIFAAVVASLAAVTLALLARSRATAA
ncbi:MAG: MFS transporter [Solirubrobacteraceae bacterium]